MTQPKEVWPFHLADTTAQLQAHRFYSFLDSGGLHGRLEGYETATEALNDLMPEMEGAEWSIHQNDLGGVAVCILSGRQFVDQLYTISGDEPITDVYGKWSEEQT